MSVVLVEGLAKSFGEVRVLRGITLNIERGEIFGILGPNGAGKTTTVECIAGAIAPDAGVVRVLEVDPYSESDLVRRRVGYQLQSSALPPTLRVGEALRLFAAFYDDPADPERLLDIVGLTPVARRPFGKLSGGQQQRLSIALALVGNPEIVVFDELTTGLDPIARREVWRMVEEIRSRGVTVVLVTHYLEEAERLCDRIAVIDRGTTAFVGTCDEMRARVGTSAGIPSDMEEAYVRLISTDPLEEV